MSAGSVLWLTATMAMTSDYCPSDSVVNRVAARRQMSKSVRGGDPAACVSEHLRHLMHAFAHKLPPGIHEGQRGYDHDPATVRARITACRSALRARGVRSVRSCRSNAGGDTLLANREFYDAHLHRLAAAEVRVLCVGVFRGESVAVWSEFFRHGAIVGVDINLAPAAEYHSVLAGLGAWQNNNVELLEADTTDVRSFRSFIAAHPETFARGFDVIIDDGCHETRCIFATYATISNLLLPGGLYFVEDNDAHYALMSTHRQWAYTSLKNGSVMDSFNTTGSEHHSIISVFKLPG